jgi:hypothetical protein
LLNDPSKRDQMSQAAVRRMARFSLKNTFDQFWERHLRAATGSVSRENVSSFAEPIGQTT